MSPHVQTGHEHALELLRVVNTSELNGVPIIQATTVRGISWWSAVQSHLYADLVAFVRTTAAPNTSFHKKRVPRERRLRDAFLVAILSFASIARILFVSGRRILVFGPDVVERSSGLDPRIGRVHAWFRAHGFNYIDFVHTKVGTTTWPMWRMRRRAALYIEVFRWMGKLLLACRIWRRAMLPINTVSFSGIAENECAALSEIVLRHVANIDNLIATGRALAIVIRFLRLDTVILFDDLRYWHEVLFAMKRARVHTIAIQHGRFSRYLPGHIYEGFAPADCIVPDEFWVWSSFWRERLIEQSPLFAHQSDSIMVAGSASLKPRIGKLPHPQGDGIISILVPYEALAVATEIRAYVEKMLTIPECRVVVKIRPDQDETGQRAWIGLEDVRITYITKLLADDFAAIDLVAATYSTYLYEMIEAGRSVLVMDSSTTQTHDLVESGLAAELSLSASDFAGVIRAAAAVDEAELDRRSAILRGADVSTIEGALARHFSRV